jgi:hypothetical protein
LANGYPLVVLAPVAGLLAYVVSQVALAQAAPGRSPYVSLSRGFVAGLAVMIIVTALGLGRMQASRNDVIGYGLLNVFCYLALAFGYFNFVNLTVASLRIRLLEELLEAGGGLSAEQLNAVYNVDSVAGLRLDRLVRGGHLVERHGRLVIGRRRFMIVARIFDFLHWLIIDCGHPGKYD